MLKKSLGINLVILLYVIVCLHLLASHFSWYWSIWWYDILMHFLGGLWVGGTAIWYLSSRWFKKRPKYFFFWVFAIVIFISISWEIFEFSLDKFVIFRKNDISDTISDLILDINGSFLAVLLVSKFFKKGQPEVLNDKELKNYNE